jgi:hypothetical protein
VKSEYGNKVLGMPDSKIEKDEVFSLRTMLIFFALALLCFFILPFWRCCKVCLCGDTRMTNISEDTVSNVVTGVPVEKHGTSVLRIAAEDDLYAQKLDLPPGSPRSTSNVASHPHSPSSPWELEDVTGEEDFIHLARPRRDVEDYDSPVAAPSADDYAPLPVNSPTRLQTQQQTNSKWTRKAKAPEGSSVAPRPSEGPLAQRDESMGVSPATVANVATVGAALYVGGNLMAGAGLGGL